MHNADPAQPLIEPAAVPGARVAFHRPWLGAAETRAVARTLRSGALQGDGPIGQAVEQELARRLGRREAVLTTSATAALDAVLAALSPEVGEVILPAFAFPSTAALLVARGFCPVFADIEPVTLGLDPEQVTACLSLRTRAIIHVDYGGWGGAIEEVAALAQQHGVPLIEDAAHALGATHQGRPLGVWGRAACLSFHETKLITCGEGGALLTDDAAMAEAARRYREYGTDRAAYRRGTAKGYAWQGSGSSLLLAEPLAALLQIQLARLDEAIARCRRISRAYREALKPWDGGAVQLSPPSRSGTESSGHTFYMLLADAAQADALITAAAQEGIALRRHFPALNRAPFAVAQGLSARLPVTESVAARLVRLPVYPGLTCEEQERVIACVLGFLGAAHA